MTEVNYDPIYQQLHKNIHQILIKHISVDFELADLTLKTILPVLEIIYYFNSRTWERNHVTWGHAEWLCKK